MGVTKIVTPFRGQVERIRAELGRLKTSVDPDLHDLRASMTVGTVHTLQGAEAPVVLFSAVNQESKAISRAALPEEQVFIDRHGGNLMNVAVSRAQKAFILFGHSDLFFSPNALRADNDLPTALLGRYMIGLIDDAHYGVKLGPTTLVIVESPAKAKAIESTLGSNYMVFGTGGHFRKLETLDLGAELRPRWMLLDDENTLPKLRRFGSRLLQTQSVVLATDADNEGEAIAWHFLEIIKSHPWWAHVKTVSRVTFPSMATLDIIRAFSQPVRTVPRDRAVECLDKGKFMAALARTVIDARVGAWYHNKGGIAAGRVKGPLLRLIAGTLTRQPARDDLRRWRIDVEVTGNMLKAPRPARLVRKGSDSTEVSFKNRFPETENGPSGATVAGLVAGKHLRFQSVLPPRIVRVRPYDGMPTYRAIQLSWKRYGIPPYRTMEILQQIYEHDLTRPGSARTEGSASTTPGLSPMVDGRLTLEAGKGLETARRLLSQPFSDISDYGFAQDVEEALERIEAGDGRYATEVAALVRRLEPALCEPEYTGAAADPSGVFLEQGTIWSDFPADKQLSDGSGRADGTSRWMTNVPCHRGENSIDPVKAGADASENDIEESAQSQATLLVSVLIHLEYS